MKNIKGRLDYVTGTLTPISGFIAYQRGAKFFPLADKNLHEEIMDEQKEGK